MNPPNQLTQIAQFLSSTVYVVGVINGDQIQLSKGQMDDGQEVVSFFDSVDAMQPFLANGSSYLSIPVRDLFRGIPPAVSLLFNPGQPNAQIFFPDVIAQLLAAPAPESEPKPEPETISEPAPAAPLESAHTAVAALDESNEPAEPSPSAPTPVEVPSASADSVSAAPAADQPSQTERRRLFGRLTKKTSAGAGNAGKNASTKTDAKKA